MVSCTQNGRKLGGRGSSSIAPRNTLQKRHSTFQWEKYVSLKYWFRRKWSQNDPLLTRPNDKVKYLHQSATLTAFGNLVFNKPIESIAAIYAIFRHAIGDDLPVSGSALHSTYEEFQAIDIANRYFTPRGGAVLEEIWSLTTEVDPNGYLAKAAGSTYVHTEENKVYYYERINDRQGGSRWETKRYRGVPC